MLAMTDEIDFDDLHAKQTFDLHSCRDMLNKLEREMKRLREAKKRTDVADHAFNAAMTAWQLTDWVARDLWIERKRPRSQDTPPDMTRDLPVDGDDPKQMAKALKKYVKEKCPELAICQTFANASKHATPVKHAVDGVAHFVGVASEGLARNEDGELDISQIDFDEMEYMGVVHVRGPDGTLTTYDLDDLVANVWIFWSSLIHQHVIG